MHYEKYFTNNNNNNNNNLKKIWLGIKDIIFIKSKNDGIYTLFKRLMHKSQQNKFPS